MEKINKKHSRNVCVCVCVQKNIMMSATFNVWWPASIKKTVIRKGKN